MSRYEIVVKAYPQAGLMIPTNITFEFHTKQEVEAFKKGLEVGKGSMDPNVIEERKFF